MTESRTAMSTSDIANAAKADPREAQPKPAAAGPTAVVDDTKHEALFPNEESQAFRTRWEAIQIGFVDDPKTAVSEADALVAQVMTRLAEVFSNERTSLEQQWARGDNISTEDLRIALRRYRSFFDRLLAV